MKTGQTSPGRENNSWGSYRVPAKWPGTVNAPLCFILAFNFILISAGNKMLAQGNIGFGTATPDSSALVHMSATDKGVLVPSMTTSQRDAISQPSNGLLIFNSANNRFEFNAGNKSAPNWVAIASLGADSSAKTEIIRDTIYYDVSPIGFTTNIKYKDIDVTVIGAKVGSSVFVTPSLDLPPDVGIAYAYVKSADSVRIRFLNISDGSQSQNPAPMDYYITIIR